MFGYDDGDDVCYGDSRVCPSHPWVRTSSPCGMFDAPCGHCEAAMEADPVEGTPVAVVQSMLDDDDLPF